MKYDDAFPLVLPSDLNNELLKLSALLTDAQEELRSHALTWAAAESAYKKAKATALLTFKTEPANAKATVQFLEALVDKAVADDRELAYIARALKESSLEAVRTLRAQLNALQSVAASVRSEMEMSRGPQPTWNI